VAAEDKPKDMRGFPFFQTSGMEPPIPDLNEGVAKNRTFG
jgi:hypothetical protein